MTSSVIGLDTSKSWFQVHGTDASGQAVRRKLPRHKLLTFFANMPRSIVGLEACGGAHHWARELAALGHEPRLMPARYVRPYVKTNKHDALMPRHAGKLSRGRVCGSCRPRWSISKRC